MKKNKISIIIPCYGTEKYLERCLESLINQTYKNLEIIIVNDCSPDRVPEISNNYAEKDDRIKIVTHDKNKGLFQARLSGAEVATGDYIAFVDSDDYVDLDFYRELLDTLIDTKSDIVVCNTVVEDYNRKYVYNLFKSGVKSIDKDDLLDEYYKQKGLNYRWHTIWNKLYTMDLWKKAVKHYSKMDGHLLMAEDFAFSSVLYFYANKLSYNDRANYFYCSNDSASTSLTKLTAKKCKKSITDIKKSFTFVENFMKEKKIYEKYKEDFIYWKNLYLKLWYDNVINAKLKPEEEKELVDLILENDENVHDFDYTEKFNFYKPTTDFNDKLIKLKNEIINSDLVSFDIFDTLVYRPLYEPKDLFIFLNSEFNKLFKSSGLLEFSKIRVEAEYRTRNYVWDQNQYQEITLDEIYDFIGDKYKLDRTKLDVIKKKEIELELSFCKRRETTYSLYKLCKSLDKKVIATSDIYLPREVIMKILENNGYTDFDKVYLSCDERLSKYTGDLFKRVLEKEKVDPENMIHIGDNLESDVSTPKKLGIKSFHYPKAIDIFNNHFPEINNTCYCGDLYKYYDVLNIDHEYTYSYLGNRVSTALVSNMYFDNPYVSFNQFTDFNTDPYFVGYYALGMHILSLASWILKDAKANNYDSIAFMARDGFLPFEASKILKNTYFDNKIDLNYIYVSRKSLMPLTLKEFKDFYKIKDYIEIPKVKIKDIIKSLKYILTDDQKKIDKVLKDNNFSQDAILDGIEEYNRFIDVVYNKLYDKTKYKYAYDSAKSYFEEHFKGNASTFDVGYSGQPELIISNMLEKPINTYFIHCNSDAGYKNSIYGNYNLKTFYEYKPTFTGTLREYLISSDQPSCIGYELDKDNNPVPIFEIDKNYTYFSKQMLKEIQNGCLDFVRDYNEMFGKYKDIIELNRYYMSLPFEYFLHYSKIYDRQIFNDLKFEHNVSDNIDMLEFWSNRISDYQQYFNQGSSYFVADYYRNWSYQMFLDQRVRPRNKLTKFFFYMNYDRVALRRKLSGKLNHDKMPYKVLSKTYHKLRRKR